MRCLFPWAPTAVNKPFLRCGQCKNCRQHNRNQWAHRLMAETATNANWPLFVTMTYADPPSQEQSIENVRNFWKRLRKNHGKLRYFSVLERGTQGSKRLHHHAIIWADWWTHSPIAKTIDREIIRPTWNLGHTDTQFTRGPAGLRYVAKYLSKNKLHQTHSKRPGLGHDLEMYWRERLTHIYGQNLPRRWKQVPGFVQRQVLGKQVAIRMTDKAFERLFRDLGVQYAPDPISLAFKGVPSGPIDKQFVRARLVA